MEFDRRTCHTLAGVMLSSLLFCSTPASADVYELRTYTTNEGKLDDLNARFRDHTVQLFMKHGMTSIGYWVPTDGPKAKNTLIYVLQHQDRDAARASWKAFLEDPEWKTVAKESQKDGQILARAPDSVFMHATNYTPAFANDGKGSDAVFELRIYRCHDGKLSKLDARFRDHTIRIFDRHALRSVAYWHPTDKPDAQDSLIYVLRHDSRDAARTSWKSFGGDPEWQKVARESQLDGKFLRERPESIYMKATDYSAMQ